MRAVALVGLLIDTSDWDDARLEREGRATYLQECSEPSKRGEVLTHDGLTVTIFPSDFDHACYKAATSSRRGWAKDLVDEKRIQRLRWICPAIAGRVDGVECWRVREWGSYRKPPPEKRLYIIEPEQFVIWLLPHAATGGFKFKTAYVANRYDIKAYVDRQTRIWPRGG